MMKILVIMFPCLDESTGQSISVLLQLKPKPAFFLRRFINVKKQGFFYPVQQKINRIDNQLYKKQAR